KAHGAPADGAAEANAPDDTQLMLRTFHPFENGCSLSNCDLRLHLAPPPRKPLPLHDNPPGFRRAALEPSGGSGIKPRALMRRLASAFASELAVQSTRALPTPMPTCFRCPAGAERL